MFRFFLPFLFVIAAACGSASNTESVKTNPRFTLEIKDAFTVVEEGINEGTILISNRGQVELNFNFEKKSTFELKKDDTLTDHIVLGVNSKNVVLLPGERHNLRVSLEGTRNDGGAFSLSLFAVEVGAAEEPVSATISFEAVFDPEEISPVQTRRCEENTLSQRMENELAVLYGLDGYFCFDVKRNDASITKISVKVASFSQNLIGLDEVNEKYKNLSFNDVETHRIEIPFSSFVASAPEEKITLSIEVEGQDLQVYKIRPRATMNSLWLTFAELQSVSELTEIRDHLDGLPDSITGKFCRVVLNLFLYRHDRLDEEETSEEQKSRVATAQSFLSEIENEHANIIDEELFLVIKGLADSYTASIKKADGGIDFIESSVKNFKDAVTLTPNDWMLRFLRGIILVDMGRGIKADFLGNIVYGDDADGWISAGKKDLNIVIDAHEFVSTKTLDWSLYNYTQQPVPDKIMTEAKRVLNNN